MFSLILLSLFAFAQTPGPETYEAKYYENAKVIRVKYTQGEAYVKRSYDEGYEEAAINLPVFENDTVGTTEGRLELYLGRLNYLRLDNDTEIEFEEAPAMRQTEMIIRVNRGGVYLDIESLDNEKDIQVQTPDCGIFILKSGLYRINVNEGGRTEMYVYDGTAEVAGDNYSRNIKRNQKVVMLDGRVRERPYYFYSSEGDEFDDWNELRNREAGYSRHGSSKYLDEGYEDYEYELSRNGRWKYNTTYHTNIWVPYNVGSQWSPYYHGRWVHHPFYGYVWHSYDTWGWYTHHYGRWHWSYYDGWCWVPGYRWSPAWVSWSRHGGYYGWSPLSRYNRPIIVLNKRWLRNHDYRRGIPVNSRGHVIVKKNQLSSSHIHKVALKKSAISSKNLTFKGSHPGEKPTISKVSVINAKGNSVVYKQGGIFSTDKYRTTSKTGISKTGAKGPVYKYSDTGILKKNANKYSKKTSGKPGSYQTGTSVLKKKGYSTGTTTTKTGQSTGTSVIKKKSYTPGTSGTTKKSYKTSSSGSYKSGGVSKKYSSPKTKSSPGYKSSSTTKVIKKSRSF